MNEDKQSKIMVTFTPYESETGKSEILFRYIMDYNLWKQTFKEYLKRYKEEKELR